MREHESKIPLGREVAYAENYDKSLLFRISRSANRAKYGIDDNVLPFCGFDLWNCYELSFLTANGLPVQRVMKLVYSAESPYIVESKSLKLYLNSFNFEKFDSEESVKNLIAGDLQQLLETEINLCLFDKNSMPAAPLPFPEIESDLTDLIGKKELQTINPDKYKEQSALLHSRKTAATRHYSFRSDMLRSNCPVTNQPDFGDLFVKITTDREIDFASVLRYIVSFRRENHFHEEVVEMIYSRFADTFEAQSLMVAAMYTRRGGIDINPARASDISLIDKTFGTCDIRPPKTFRQ